MVSRMDNNSVVLDSVFRALADPTRRAVVERLGAGPATVSELAQPFGMALPSFLKHLAVLEDCGLIGSEKSGRVRICAIRPETLLAAESWMIGQRILWEGRTDRLVDYVESLSRKEET